MKKKLFLQKLAKSFFLTLSISIAVQSYAAPPGNRIDGPIDRSLRCLIDSMNEDFCYKERIFALEKKCINQDEYDSLVIYRAIPACNRNNELIAWCNCGSDTTNNNFENHDLNIFDIK
ncbi:hypothetical protein [Fluviispira multicolorata]|uniref:Uncharacterized protein n=1 Tax=Fluviispira multicolorata TaxID=2654512 RepID=A0A833JEV1_9BACT|nr:hypothetical protein [Fluviispira multicolorata]KAB8032267.1 hypothetical protein GCL57_06355 [Fluviispira multicolorata]